MTGYSANVEAFVNTTAGEYVPFGSFGVAYFVIHDGWRIKDLQSDHLVAGEGANLSLDFIMSSNSA